LEFLAKFHPLVVHFPIAFLTLYVFLEVISQIFKRKFLSNLTHLILLLGVIGGITAVLTGNMEFQFVIKSNLLNQVNNSQISNHEYYATITMWYFFAGLIIKTYILVKKKNQTLFNYLFIIFALVGFYLIFTTAKLGGKLVYEFGIGTNLFK
jgi:uncharacterized membrane protein